MPATHMQFHFEEYWLSLDGFQGVVTEAWNSVWDNDPFQRLRLQTTACKLMS
jgi:hypothetical protein